ncbi:ABC transporter permease [Cyclobacterium jeungdonense]|uniref:ABC transporter permease n=1 Tax=Cyclobacterium jeungdonense TaxID=708087 RepID=A0ABT8C9T8_9BACT|nr:ABC transporter permease [Cyclobacterium jeungdonense]MDN3688530.1 ABC transporter permease [Cyclobacterium jeungdonense]
MLKNYFKIAYRSLLRHKIFSTINILGLSIGIASCLICLLFVKNEWSYDRFHKKSDRIFRVVFQGNIQGEVLKEAHVMPPVAEALLADYPEVLAATRIRLMGSPTITVDEDQFRNHHAAFVDANFFEVFTFPLLKGNPEKALIEPNSLVLSQSVAETYFGGQDPLGKVIWMNDGKEGFTITGVMADMPQQSHFRFDMLASMSTFPEASNPSFMVSEFYTYLVLPEQYDYRKLEAKMPQVTQKYIGPQLQTGMGISLEAFQAAGNKIGLYLQPLTDIHLHSDLMGELGSGGDIRYVYIFIAIAVFMLLIACINFINLSTASGSRRAREVGVRKVLGAAQRQLRGQFLAESILLSGLALLLALALLQLTLPFFNDFSEVQLSFSLSENGWLLPFLLLFGLSIGVLAGAYPAFFLSSFSTVSVLKSAPTGHPGKGKVSLRSGLVVFQFCISIILIMGSMVVYRQLGYIQNKDLGYEKEQVLILPDVGQLGNNAEAFRQQLLQDERVVHVSISGYLPSGPSYNNNYFVFPEDDPSLQIKTLRYDVDEEYVPTLGLELITGRNFSIEYGSDDAAMLINETAAIALGWENDALGKHLSHSNNEGERTSYRIIGVVKDFHFRSMHERIAPLVMTLGSGNGAVIAKINTDQVTELLESIKDKWTSMAGNEPFTYSFLDDRFYQTYATERKMGKVVTIFSGLTVFIASMGLFGLATFTTKQRTKEIGIRKVLGAEIAGIVLMLSGDFLKLVGIAAICAFPISAWVMGAWLEGFAYRIAIGPWTYLGAGMIAAIVAFLTTGYLALQAARTNPVTNLRNE